jgi:hypothetical protein
MISIGWTLIAYFTIWYDVSGQLLNEIEANQCNAFHSYEKRRWSLSGTIVTNNDSIDSKKCSNYSLFIESIGKGERHCSLNLPSKERTCSVMNMYSHVNFIGYSHLRHNSIALLILLSSDVVGGGMINLHNQSFSQNYRCDKQFDEDPRCRFEKTERHFLDINETSSNSLCKLPTNPSSFTFQYRIFEEFNNETLSCNTGSDRRPQFLFFRDFSGNTEGKVLRNLHHSLKNLMRLINHLETTCVSITKFKVVVGTQARQAKNLILDTHGRQNHLLKISIKS